jgi:hypothetical protein
MPRSKFSELRDQLMVEPGAAKKLADARRDTLEEFRLFELRDVELISQVELAARRHAMRDLDV